jgi:hypothetical protein
MVLFDRVADLKSQLSRNNIVMVDTEHDRHFNIYDQERIA